jgi:diguanylate cyclase (GGDEF)-like protein
MEEKKRQRRLEAQPLEFARLFVRGLPEPAVLMDREYRPIEYNSQYLSLCGIGRASVVSRVRKGATSFELLGRAPNVDEIDARNAMDKAQPCTVVQNVVRNVAGYSYTASITFLPVVGTDGAVYGVIQIIRDETAESRMQKRYKELLQHERDHAEALEATVKARTGELLEALDEVTRLSRTDALTGLLNRRAFIESAEQTLALAERKERGAALLLFDLDHFKRINDLFGHQAGDALLVEATVSLRRALRGTDALARFGGEEFVALLSEVNHDVAVDVANRCRRSVCNVDLRSIIPELKDPQTVSVGLSFYPDHGRELDTLIQRADEALYFAKGSGRDRVVVFDHSLISTQAPPSGAINCNRVLVVSPDGDRVQQYLDLLEDFEAVGCQSMAAVVALCQREQFDTIVLDEAVARDQGLELFLRTARSQSRAIRVLMVDSKEACFGLAPHFSSSVHCLLLHSDAEAYLVSAIEHTQARVQVELYSRAASVQGKTLSSNWLRDQIQRILNEQDFDFAYQPIVTVPEGDVFGYEALLRVHAGSIRQPQGFVDAAVQCQCVWSLGRLVRHIACQPLAFLPDDMMLFINLHPDELDDPELFAESPLASRIVLEITERSSIVDYGKFQAMLKELQALGYRVAVDDLGGGYAGLNSIALLEPDFVKIDRSIIRDIDQSRRNRSLASSLVRFANDTGISILAEGVETEQEARAIADIGFHLAQGYYYGKPGRL